MIDAAGNTSIVSAAGGLVTFNNTHLAAYTASGALVTDGANVTVVQVRAPERWAPPATATLRLSYPETKLLQSANPNLAR